MTSHAALPVLLADLFHGDNPNMEPLGRGDFTEFMQWRDRHAADTVLPESEMVR